MLGGGEETQKARSPVQQDDQIFPQKLGFGSSSDSWVLPLLQPVPACLCPCPCFHTWTTGSPQWLCSRTRTRHLRVSRSAITRHPNPTTAHTKKRCPASREHIANIKGKMRGRSQRWKGWICTGAMLRLCDTYSANRGNFFFFKIYLPFVWSNFKTLLGDYKSTTLFMRKLITYLECSRSGLSICIFRIECL